MQSVSNVPGRTGNKPGPADIRRVISGRSAPAVRSEGILAAHTGQLYREELCANTRSTVNPESVVRKDLREMVITRRRFLRPSEQLVAASPIEGVLKRERFPEVFDKCGRLLRTDLVELQAQKPTRTVRREGSGSKQSIGNKRAGHAVEPFTANGCGTPDSQELAALIDCTHSHRNHDCRNAPVVEKILRRSVIGMTHLIEDRLAGRLSKLCASRRVDGSPAVQGGARCLVRAENSLDVVVKGIIPQGGIYAKAVPFSFDARHAGGIAGNGICVTEFTGD